MKKLTLIGLFSLAATLGIATFDPTKCNFYVDHIQFL